jgi:phosphatidylserine decarboxylase
MNLAQGHEVITIPSLILFILSIVLSLFETPFWFLIPLTGLILIFVIQFFRDPERNPLDPDPNAIIAPADGVLFEIDTQSIPGTTIFRIRMRFWDVHVNRMPMTGKMLRKQKFKGAYLPILPKLNHISKTRNARQEMDFQNSDGISFKVVQISGFLAFRCVSYHSESETLIIRGDRLGMIRFGSETDLHVPTKNLETKISIGKKLKAGVTILGYLK